MELAKIESPKGPSFRRPKCPSQKKRGQELEAQKMAEAAQVFQRIKNEGLLTCF
jgi:hypothetical protein